MNKNVWLLAAGALTLASCQPVVFVGEGAHTRGISVARHGEVVVTVVESGSAKRIQINQDPVLSVDDGPGRRKVKWDLATDGYRFLQAPPPSNSGIELCPASKPCPQPPRNARCSNGAKQVVCSWDRPEPGVVYSYTIRVVGVPDFDPSIMN